MTTIKFTESEIAAMQEDPGVLRALAEYHDVKQSEANGMDYPDAARFHEARRKELSAEADRIEAGYLR